MNISSPTFGGILMMMITVTVKSSKRHYVQIQTF